MTDPIRAWASCPTCKGGGVIYDGFICEPGNRPRPNELPCPTCLAHNLAVDEAVKAEREALIIKLESICEPWLDQQDSEGCAVAILCEMSTAIRARTQATKEETK